ncbi:hypothetical protein KBY93_00840 [Synechococcus sp. J7-Johnson]|uniref:hypothetical protein n=1 Tax=Synechococcus sp. J7-Johnson TaxID=2823737 RepID=UPI0020CE98D3|nr:hypothetical protein [Synechococcus sp. J7-Johnson]MCP9839178.1 hypothetical protein [Synechococcus sp. J7-Johnson]
MSEAGARRRSRGSTLETPSPPKRWAPWVLPLAAGLCFGVGYGLTDRLLSLGQGEPVKLDQSFDPKPFPGTSLESLRLRFGADRQELRGDLELIELEREQQEAAAKSKREAAETAAQKAKANSTPSGTSAEPTSSADSGAAAEAPRSEPIPEPSPPSLEVPPPPAPDLQP